MSAGRGCFARPFEPGDAEAVSALVAALNREEGYSRATPPDAAELRAAFLGADPAGFLLVAEAGGAPVGYATGHATYETEFAARGVHMGDLYVAPGHRRRGAGRALVAGMAAEARARGARFLWWTALPGNAGAHGFYRAIGGTGEDLRAFALADEAFERLAGAAPWKAPRVRVRAARPEEAEAVAALFNAINSMDGPPPPVAMTADAVRRDLLGAAPRAALLVAESDGAVVGFATGNTVYDSARAADAMFLNDLYVAPEARRRGVGRALVARLAAVARGRGARCLWWGVDLGDDEALRFYEALGADDEGGFVGRILVGPAFEALATQGTE